MSIIGGRHTYDTVNTTQDGKMRFLLSTYRMGIQEQINGEQRRLILAVPV